MIKEVNSENAMKSFGARLGALLEGGEVIELIGDVGAGKTTLAKGIALGLGIDEDVQSPSFTISRVYAARDGITMAHYDFYRLTAAGIMASELGEATRDPKTIVLVEWGGIVDNILPTDRLSINIEAHSESSRHLSILSGGPISLRLQERL